MTNNKKSILSLQKIRAEIIEFAVIVDLPDIGGSKKIRNKDVNVYAQTEFEGD